MMRLVESVCIPVADEDNQRQTVPELVRTGGGTGSVGTAEFVKQPVLGGR